MIVCSCNLIREREIREAARSGAPCPRTAYANLGFQPECCGCLDHAADIIAEERSKLLGCTRQVAA